MKLTIFTPTYNRGYIIENLYRSLLRQSCMDFEWLVVDDGSTDNTAELFAGWMALENPFPIRYYTQPNGGKHRAINRGVPMAKGEMFFIVDSDDYLTDDAVEVIIKQEAELPLNGKNAYAGICNLRAYTNGQPNGTSFEGVYVDCTALEREKYGISGDKAEVFFTDVMKRYPFPEYEGENFVTEAVVWDAMAADGMKLRFFNKVTYLCDYLPDGLTNKGLDLYYKNPQGYGLYLRQCRANAKFGKKLQRYYDVECFLAWRNRMSLWHISELINVHPAKLVWNVMVCQLWTLGSNIKHWLFGG